METLNITKEAAITAHANANRRGKRLLEHLLGKEVFKKEVTDRIKSFDDVLEELNIEKDDFELSLMALSKDERAYRKVKLIAEALNEGWKPDWTDGEWNKWYPWFDMGGSSGSGFAFDGADDLFAFSCAGSRLCFKSRDLAIYAGTTFTDIYKDFFTA